MEAFITSYRICGSGIREPLVWTGRAQGGSAGCSHMLPGTGPWKTRLELEELPPRWLAHVPGKLVPTIVRRPQLIPHGPAHRAA